MTAISIKNLEKVFDEDIVAVDDVSLEVEDGEFLVIVGPSGCGKSTTLNMIAGLETPTRGEIRINDEDVTDERPQERDIAMVFQNYALYPHMDVRQNIRFGLKMRTSLSDAELNERTEEVAKLLDIEELLNQHPRDLSGGQQQRVALGRAIARDPEVFLMDEPLSNLDAKLRTQMRTELQDLQNKLNVTTIYVTHDQTEAMTMSDRIAILNGGKLQQVGTPMECYHQPNNQFVAGFIGAPNMNFFDGKLKETRLTTSSLEYSLSESFRDQLPKGSSEVVLGVRPQDFIIDTSHIPNAIETTVRVTEPMGDVTNVTFETNGVTYTATVEGAFNVESGTPIYVSFPEESIYLFDAEGGETLFERPIPDKSKEHSALGQSVE